MHRIQFVPQHFACFGISFGDGNGERVEVDVAMFIRIELHVRDIRLLACEFEQFLKRIGQSSAIGHAHGGHELKRFRSQHDAGTDFRLPFLHRPVNDIQHTGDDVLHGLQVHWDPIDFLE